jgi:hypothetical protein
VLRINNADSLRFGQKLSSANSAFSAVKAFCSGLIIGLLILMFADVSQFLNWSIPMRMTNLL